MINLPTNFEVPNIIRSGDMKNVEKCTKWSGLGRLGVTLSHRQFDGARTTSYSSLIETIRLSCTVFETQRVICRNSATTPSAFGAPVGGTPFEFRKDFWHQKTRVPGLSCGGVCVILCVSRFDTIPACDRQTDRQTHKHTDIHTTTANTVLA